MKKVLILCLLFLSGFSLLGAQGLVRYVWLPSWDIYIPGTSSSYGDMPLSEFRWNTGTHFSTFAVPMNSTGSAITWNNLLVDRRKPVNDKAHAAGKPIYLCLGGSGSDGWMSSAFSAANRSTAIATLISTMETYQYDGFDFDWEPFSKSDTAIFYPFVRQLHAALQSKRAYYDATKNPDIILTMSPGGSQWGAALKPMEPYLKFVVLMAYDKMGTWTGVSYYDCAVTARDATGTIVQRVGSQEPATVERQAAQTVGFDPMKIVVGIDMMGAMLPGNTAPFQQITASDGSINVDVKYDTFYKDVLMASPRPVVQYDAIAGAYWVTRNGNFYSFMGAPGYDAAMGKAFSLLQAKGYGGIAIWDMTEAYLGTGKFPATSYPGLDRDWVGTQLLKWSGGVNPPPPPPPPPPSDVTPPTVSLTAPASLDTVAGTIQISVTATDASGISIMRLKVDGNFTGASDASSPYSFSWNSASVPNGAHTLAAEATDGAGLKTTAGVQVVVRNASTPPPPPPPPAGGTVTIYDDKLASPWFNASWGAVNTFNSAEQKFEGTSSIKSVQNAWGSISARSGSWSLPVDVNTSAYDTVSFAVYPEEPGLFLAVWFDSDVSGELPKVTRSNIPADRWTVISIPVDALNEGNQVVHQLNIQNYTSQLRTYYADRIVFNLAGASQMGASTKPTGIGTESVVPDAYSLAQNYPNPFNPTTTIGFALPQASRVTLRVYDVTGREVRTILAGELGAGFGSVQWDSRNDAGATLSSGVYLYRIEAIAIEGSAEVFVQTRRMILLK